MYVLAQIRKFCNIARVECGERIQIVRLSVLMNNLISFRERYSNKRYFVPNLAKVCFISHVFHRWQNRSLSAKQTIVNANKAHSISAEILIYFSRGQIS